MSSFSRRAFPKGTPEPAQTRYGVETSTRGTPRPPLVAPPSAGGSGSTGNAVGGIGGPRVKTGDGGQPSRMGRERYVHGSDAEVHGRSLPSLFEFDPALHHPVHPGQREAVNTAGSNVNEAPITTRDYPPLGELPEEEAIAYIAPKSHRRRSIPVEQLADKSDAAPMPLNEDGSRLDRT